MDFVHKAPTQIFIILVSKIWKMWDMHRKSGEIFYLSVSGVFSSGKWNTTLCTVDFVCFYNLMNFQEAYWKCIKMSSLRLLVLNSKRIIKTSLIEFFASDPSTPCINYYVYKKRVLTSIPALRLLTIRRASAMWPADLDFHGPSS